MTIHDNQLMSIDDNRLAIKKHNVFGHRLVIDSRCQSINCYRLLSITPGETLVSTRSAVKNLIPRAFNIGFEIQNGDVW